MWRRCVQASFKVRGIMDAALLTIKVLEHAGRAYWGTTYRGEECFLYRFAPMKAYANDRWRIVRWGSEWPLFLSDWVNLWEPLATPVKLPKDDEGFVAFKRTDLARPVKQMTYRGWYLYLPPERAARPEGTGAIPGLFELVPVDVEPLGEQASDVPVELPVLLGGP